MGRVRIGRFVAALMAVYVVGLGVLVASPWGWELNRLTVRLYALFRYNVPIAPGWVLPEHYGVLLNVLLFLPLGAMLAEVTGRAWWAIVLACLAVSVTVELVQWRWLARDGDWSDVVSNTLGGVLGVVAIRLLRRGPRAPGPRSA